MKVEVEETKKSVVEYPYIGISENGNGRMVLFIAPTTGIQISELDNEMGAYTDNWAESSFRPFTGTVTLSND